MLVADFVETRFREHVVSKKKKAGQQHYDYLLRAFVLPNLGHRRLCDIGMGDVETLVATVRAKGYSHQTILHAKNCVSAVFRHARRLKLYTDENPAHDVDLGEKPIPQKRPTYTWEQAALVLAHLKSPVKEMALLSIATSMNVAEMCGIREKRCNFTNTPIVIDGEVYAPYSIAVRENFYANQYGSLKKGTRCRNVPLTAELAGQLAKLLHGIPDGPLFASRNGTPMDAHNISNRTFKPIERHLGFPLTWHAFRRAHSSFAGQLEGIPIEDRVATMGHADARMSMYYSVPDLERRRRLPREILARIQQQSGNEPESIQ
jgi:integrase